MHCPLAFASQYLRQNLARDIQIKNRFFLRFLWNFANPFLSRLESPAVGLVDFFKKVAKTH